MKQYWVIKYIVVLNIMLNGIAIAQPKYGDPYLASKCMPLKTYDKSHNRDAKNYNNMLYADYESGNDMSEVKLHIVKGRVLDMNCIPASGALLEISLAKDNVVSARATSNNLGVFRIYMDSKYKDQVLNIRISHPHFPVRTIQIAPEQLEKYSYNGGYYVDIVLPSVSKYRRF
jgi:hypothetical protein